MTRNRWNRTSLAGKGLLNFAGKPTGNVTVKCLTKHMTYVFWRFHVCFFSYVLKKTNTLHTREDHVATRLYHGCKNLTHSSKTRQAKRTGWPFACRFLFGLLSIERNETVARKDMRLKPEPSPENLQQGDFTFAQERLDVLKIWCWFIMFPNSVWRGHRRSQRRGQRDFKKI